MICTNNQSAKQTVLVSVRIQRTYKQNMVDSLLIRLNFAEVLQAFLLQLMHFFVGDKISGRLGKNITPYAKLLFHLYVNITLRVVVVVDCMKKGQARLTFKDNDVKRLNVRQQTLFQ